MSEGGDTAGKSRGTVSSKQTSRGKESHRVSRRARLTEHQSQRTREMDKIFGGRETQTEPAEAEAEGAR